MPNLIVILKASESNQPDLDGLNHQLDFLVQSGLISEFEIHTRASLPESGYELKTLTDQYAADLYLFSSDSQVRLSKSQLESLILPVAIDDVDICYLSRPTSQIRRRWSSWLSRNQVNQLESSVWVFSRAMIEWLTEQAQLNFESVDLLLRLTQEQKWRFESVPAGLDRADESLNLKYLLITCKKWLELRSNRENWFYLISIWLALAWLIPNGLTQGVILIILAWSLRLQFSGLASGLGVWLIASWLTQNSISSDQILIWLVISLIWIVMCLYHRFRSGWLVFILGGLLGFLNLATIGLSSPLILIFGLMYRANLKQIAIFLTGFTLTKLLVSPGLTGIFTDVSTRLWLLSPESISQYIILLVLILMSLIFWLRDSFRLGLPRLILVLSLGLVFGLAISRLLGVESSLSAIQPLILIWLVYLINQVSRVNSVWSIVFAGILVGMFQL